MVVVVVRSKISFKCCLIWVDQPFQFVQGLTNFPRCGTSSAKTETVLDKLGQLVTHKNAPISYTVNCYIQDNTSDTQCLLAVSGEALGDGLADGCLFLHQEKAAISCLHQAA